MKHYSDEQYALMLRLRGGMEWTWCADTHADAVLRFLFAEGIAEPRCDVSDNWVMLSQRGEVILSSYEQMCNQRAEENAQKRADEAQRVKDKKKSYQHDFAVAAFSSAFTLALEHIGDIVDFIKRLF